MDEEVRYTEGKGNDNLVGGPDNEIVVGGEVHDVFECGEGIDSITNLNPKEDYSNSSCEEL